MNFAEGGQSSTGSIIRWAKQNLFEQQQTGESDSLSYKDLDEEASLIPPGCDGLVALETFQGSRTPITDPRARGALMGLTLSHNRAHIWRALMESVCFGTRACIEGLANAGHDTKEIIIAGGATRSPLWLQMHADVSGLPVIVCENGDAPLLGCAVLAAVGVGIHKDVENAVKAMVRHARRVAPEVKATQQYAELYENIYTKVGEASRPIAHAISDLRGGARSDFHSQPPVASPSLLASDLSNIQGEVHRCIQASASRFHVDIFDGVFLDSPYALTFGPQMVSAIRRSCTMSEQVLGIRDAAILDLHMCVDRPERYVKAMAEAGGDRFIFQWEAMKCLAEDGSDGRPLDHLNKAVQLAKAVHEAGMKCGVSINPGTNETEIYPLLETGMVDLIDVLAVEPGFGGQRFQANALEKIETLKHWRQKNFVSFDILVDGGINNETAPAVIDAGADILVAGTYLFHHPEGIGAGVSDILKGTKTR
jgi:ribulose-phosphate 3-epimerase